MNAMKIDDFISKVSSESERTVARTVRAAPPSLLAKAASPSGLRLTDLLAASDQRIEQRVARYRHILGAPASQQVVAAWQSRHPSHLLPADLRALVTRINGIHLWANVETGRSYTGLAPIEEWDLTVASIFGPAASGGLLDDRYTVISYHQDGASFMTLDLVSQKYFLMDAAGPDTTSLIANNVEELLDWLWRSRIVPTA